MSERSPDALKTSAYMVRLLKLPRHRAYGSWYAEGGCFSTSTFLL